MNFDEWHENDETIIQNDIEVYDLGTAYNAGYNAAINEAVKIAGKVNNSILDKQYAMRIEELKK